MKLHSLLMAALAIISSVMTARAQQSDELLPTSVGIVLDTSGSMSFKLSQARQIVAAVMNSATPSDEFAVIQAADRPIALSGFAGASSVLPTLRFIQPKGRSALLDGIYLGTQLMKMAHNERKVLLVISDGLDHTSRKQEIEIVNLASYCSESPIAVMAGRLAWTTLTVCRKRRWNSPPPCALNLRARQIACIDSARASGASN